MSKRKTTDEFISDARRVHGDKYDYSKVEYINNETKICIICPKHGEFWQTPNKRLLRKGCTLCGNNRISISRLGCKEEFIEKAKKIHGDRYDYSFVEYVNRKTPIKIICPEHGEFLQTPSNHLHHGCPKCKETSLERIIRVYLDSNNIPYIYQYNSNWLGRQTLDFYLPSLNAGIECQGGQHYFPVPWYGGEKSFLKIKERDKKKFEKCKRNNLNLYYFTEKMFIKYQLDAYCDIDELFNAIKSNLNN
jgi:hypothetical protein